MPHIDWKILSSRAALYNPQKTKLGGKYGTSINLNFSTTFEPRKDYSSINTNDSSLVTYKTTPFDMSDSLYWRDINVNISRKKNKKVKLKLSYFNIVLNNDVVKISNDSKGMINSHIAVIDASYKINRKHSIRAELQGLFVLENEYGQRDKGDWATALIEYSISPKWFFSVMNQYNYGNPDEDKKVHYPIFSCGY